jgi:hypothetical protein
MESSAPAPVIRIDLEDIRRVVRIAVLAAA